MYRTKHEYRQNKIHVIQQLPQFDIKTIYGIDLQIIEDFKYFSVWVDSSENMSISEKRKIGDLPPDEKDLEFKTQ